MRNGKGEKKMNKVLRIRRPHVAIGTRIEPEEDPLQEKQAERRAGAFRSVLWLLAIVAAFAALAALPSVSTQSVADGGEKISVKLRALGTPSGAEGTLGA